MAMVALEARGQILQAVRKWKRSFREGAERHKRSAGEAFWHDRLGIWGLFAGVDSSNRPPEIYYNGFGRQTSSLGQKTTVVINPPVSGINKQFQGVIARHERQERWILRRGHMHAHPEEVNHGMFAAVTILDPVEVSFSDGSSLEYYPVANIDAQSIDVQDQTARFVLECARVRLHYAGGERVANWTAAIGSVGTGYRPEAQGTYVIPGQDPKVADRKHADVSGTLAKELRKRGIEYNNASIGLYEPDLWTQGKRRVLFEIKTSAGAADIQQGVGQLFLYEKLLGAKYRKVLVIPEAPSAVLSKAMTELGLSCLGYTRKGRSVRFDDDGITRLLGG